jgi:hypothetical protein
MHTGATWIDHTYTGAAAVTRIRRISGTTIAGANISNAIDRGLNRCVVGHAFQPFQHVAAPVLGGHLHWRAYRVFAVDRRTARNKYPTHVKVARRCRFVERGAADHAPGRELLCCAHPQ